MSLMMPAGPTKGGAAKDRAMNAKTFVTDVRARYERVVNAELERAGVDARISMKANPRQEPEPKLGPAHQRADLQCGTRCSVGTGARAAHGARRMESGGC